MIKTIYAEKPETKTFNLVHCLIRKEHMNPSNCKIPCKNDFERITDLSFFWSNFFVNLSTAV